MKRLVSIFTAVLLLCAGLATARADAAGSSSDPLVTVGYLTGTLLPSIQSDTQTKIDGVLGQQYKNASADIENAYGDALQQMGIFDGYTMSAMNAPFTFRSGDTASLVMGSSFTLASGSASVTVQKGTVLDLSSGAQVSSGASVQPGRRYFCCEDTSATVTATSPSTGFIDGFYRTSASPTPHDAFIDVSSAAWYRDAVGYVVGKGFFNGTSSLLFTPQGSMTRGMFVTVLYRLAGSPAQSGASAFSDIADTSLYYYKAVVWASANNIVTGYDDGQFHPDALVTREQMAAVLYRYADFAGYSVQAGDSSSLDAFPDSGNVSSFAVSAMRWAVCKGLVSGSDGYLLPQNTATRAQVAQIVMNFCQKSAGMA